MFYTDSNDPHKTGETLGYDQSSKDTFFSLSLALLCVAPWKVANITILTL